MDSTGVRAGVLAVFVRDDVYISFGARSASGKFWVQLLVQGVGLPKP